MLLYVSAKTSLDGVNTLAKNGNGELTGRGRRQAMAQTGLLVAVSLTAFPPRVLNGAVYLTVAGTSG